MRQTADALRIGLRQGYPIAKYGRTRRNMLPLGAKKSIQPITRSLRSKTIALRRFMHHNRERMNTNVLVGTTDLVLRSERVVLQL